MKHKIFNTLQFFYTVVALHALHQHSDSNSGPMCSPFDDSLQLPSWLVNRIHNVLDTNISFFKKSETPLDGDSLCQISASLLMQVIHKEAVTDCESDESTPKRFPTTGTPSRRVTLVHWTSFNLTDAVEDTKIPHITITEYASPLTESLPVTEKGITITPSTTEPDHHFLPTNSLLAESTTAPPFPDSHLSISTEEYFLALEFVARTIFEERGNDCLQKGGNYMVDVGRCRMVYFRSLRMMPYRDEIIENIVERTITIVGTCISFVLLTVLLIIYLVLKRLRPLAGCSIICLAIILQIIELLRLVVSLFGDTSTICRSVAILLHWCYLSTFVWTSLICFDLVTFIRPLQKVSKREKLICNITLGFFIPTAILGALLAIELTSGHIGYGKGQICFIGELWPNFFSNVMFAICSLLLNLFCLTRTITGFCNQKQVPNTVFSREQVSRGDMLSLTLMTTKLSILTSTSWLFGFVGTLTENAVLIYLFLILTSFQGTIVFFAFVCNRRVFRIAVKYYKYRRSVQSVKGLRLKVQATT